MNMLHLLIKTKPPIYIFLILIAQTYGNRFESPKDLFETLAQNENRFDFGFTFTYVGEEPFEFEYYLFIGQHFWRIHKRNDERQVCVEKLDSEQHLDFNREYELAFSYMSDHMVQHSNELNLTNHVLLQLKGESIGIHEDYRESTREIIETIFDANHDNLQNMITQDYYVFQIPDFKPSVAFQPQSFVDNEITDGPNFVFIQQNRTDEGYERRIEVHSIIDDYTIIRNRTEQYGNYTPAFIGQLDRKLYINVILPTRLGPGGYDEGVPSVVLLLLDEGVIKYCVTEETSVDESCKVENLRNLEKCIERDEL